MYDRLLLGIGQVARFQHRAGTNLADGVCYGATSTEYPQPVMVTYPVAVGFRCGANQVFAPILPAGRCLLLDLFNVLFINVMLLFEFLH